MTDPSPPERLRLEGCSVPNEEGVSLIELMVAAVVAVIALGAILTVTIRHNSLQRFDEELSQAFLAARSNLEMARSVAIADLPSMDGVGFDVPTLAGVPGGLTPVPNDPDGLPGLFSVVEEKTTGSSVLYRVKAIVTWTGVMREQAFELETLITERK